MSNFNILHLKKTYKDLQLHSVDIPLAFESVPISSLPPPLTLPSSGPHPFSPRPQKTLPKQLMPPSLFSSEKPPT